MFVVTDRVMVPGRYNGSPLFLIRLLVPPLPAGTICGFSSLMSLAVSSFISPRATPSWIPAAPHPTLRIPTAGGHYPRLQLSDESGSILFHIPKGNSIL